jgi:hypothetical protein
MTGPRVARGADLLAELADLIASSTLEQADQVIVSADVRDLDKTKRPGAVVLMPTPELTFPAPGVVEVGWRVMVVAAPGDDLLAAWGRLDELLEVLRAGGLHVERAEPGDYPVTDSPVKLPGYTLTVPEQLDDY